eukprot:scaffold106908_cov57-Phaeocystis_antarctica.AAC.2
MNTHAEKVCASWSMEWMCRYSKRTSCKVSCGGGAVFCAIVSGSSGFCCAGSDGLYAIGLIDEVAQDTMTIEIPNTNA